MNLLTNPALDPYAGIPEFKVCAVKLEPVRDDDADALATTSSHSERVVIPSEQAGSPRNVGR